LRLTGNTERSSSPAPASLKATRPTPALAPKMFAETPITDEIHGAYQLLKAIVLSRLGRTMAVQYRSSRQSRS
jgi:hypothetical protein